MKQRRSGSCDRMEVIMFVPELLAPAGSMESLKAAIAGGADAVYMGGLKFGARAYAENPDEEGICDAIDLAHLHGVKLYMTVNTLMKERELENELLPFLERPYRAGVDAVLVQDLGVLSVIKKHFPALPVHISTQMTVASSCGAWIVKRMGAERLVLPRELSLPEIIKIKKATEIEVETFIHGALCYCYSGQCLMSSMIGGRSGNRGRCAQPCRLPYRKDGNRKAEYYLNLKDICSLRLLPELAAAGIASLKIEGRMKSPSYTLGTTAVYRKYLDLLRNGGHYEVDPEDVRFLLALFDRGGYSAGYYHTHNGPEMISREEKPAKRIVDEALLNRYFRQFPSEPSDINIKGTLKVIPGKCATIKMTGCGHEITVNGPVIQEAVSRPMTADEIRKRMMKTGGSGFAFSELEVVTEGAPFIPVGELNRFRRDAIEAIRKEILDAYRRIS